MADGNGKFVASEAKCSGEYFDKQQPKKQYCGVHAINNLFGRLVYSPEEALQALRRTYVARGKTPQAIQKLIGDPAKHGYDSEAVEILSGGQLLLEQLRAKDLTTSKHIIGLLIRRYARDDKRRGHWVCVRRLPAVSTGPQAYRLIDSKYGCLEMSQKDLLEYVKQWPEGDVIIVTAEPPAWTQAKVAAARANAGAGASAPLPAARAKAGGARSTPPAARAFAADTAPDRDDFDYEFASVPFSIETSDREELAQARRDEEEGKARGWYTLGEPEDAVPAFRRDLPAYEDARAAYEDARAAYEDAMIREAAADGDADVAGYQDYEVWPADGSMSILDMRGGCGCARAAAKPVAGGCGQARAATKPFAGGYGKVRAAAQRAASGLAVRNLASRARTRRSAAASQKPKSMRRLRRSGGHGSAKGVRRRTSGTMRGRGRGGRR